MAAGTFIHYTSAILRMARGAVDIASGTWVAVPLKSSYTPSEDHSDFATQVISSECSDPSSSASLRKVLTTIEWTKSAANNLRFDAADYAISASGVAKVKYILIMKQDASFMLGYFDTNVGVTTGVEVNTINVTLPAAGMWTSTHST